jgi:hypothetical protein
MIPVLQGQDFTTAAEFTKALNTARLANKQKWITYTGTVAGKQIGLKAFDTGYLQILRVNGICHGGAMDLKVGEWKARIEKAIG